MCSGTAPDVQRLIRHARYLIDGQDGEWSNVRMLNVVAAPIHGTELFMGWLQLIRLQSKDIGFQEARQRMIHNAFPPRRAMEY